MPWADVAIALACVAFALWVHRRSLGAFFSLDDLVILQEFRGLRPHEVQLWRFFSGEVYFRAAAALFGPDPFPYHLVNWLLHGANVALLYVFVRGRAGSMAAAAVAAALFGTSRLHVTALGSAATVGEPLALGLTLGAFLLHDRGLLARLAAPLLFACALLSKESVVLLPLVLLLPRPGGVPLRERLWRAAPLIVLGAFFVVALVATGTGGTHLGGQAYARAFGANLFHNLMTYTRWVADLRDPFPGLVSAIAPDAWPVGLAATAALGLLVVIARGARLPPALGALWWLLSLVPVLPLLHHTYLYYLYMPLAGLAMALAGTVGWVARRAADRPGRAAARGAPLRTPPSGGTRDPVDRGRAIRGALAGLAIVGVAAHGLSADRLLVERASRRLMGTGVPLDPELRKSEIARHASQAVAKRLGDRPGRVAFLLPAGLRQIYSTATGEVLEKAAPDSGSYSMLAGSLDQGLGLRALQPNLDSVAFLPGWMPGHADFELFGQSPDGTVFPLGRGADGFAEASATLLGGRDLGPARELLEGALSEFPDHAPLRYQYARLHYLAGDSLGMRLQLDELLRRAPDHPLAARVRAGFPPGAGGR